MENEGREVNYGIYVDETVAVTLQEEDENENDEVNRLLTEMQNLLRRTNLVERFSRACGRIVEEQEMCAERHNTVEEISTKVVLIEGHARRIAKVSVRNTKRMMRGKASLRSKWRLRWRGEWR